MTVKSSISLTDSQDNFVRDLVSEGRFSSASAVIQQGLDLLRQQTEAQEAEVAALQVILKERADGDFVTSRTMRTNVADMIAKKRNTSVAG